MTKLMIREASLQNAIESVLEKDTAILLKQNIVYECNTETNHKGTFLAVSSPVKIREAIDRVLQEKKYKNWDELAPQLMQKIIGCNTYIPPQKTPEEEDEEWERNPGQGQGMTKYEKEALERAEQGIYG